MKLACFSLNNVEIHTQKRLTSPILLRNFHFANTYSQKNLYLCLPFHAYIYNYVV